jgi:hypothetical protein
MYPNLFIAAGTRGVCQSWAVSWPYVRGSRGGLAAYENLNTWYSDAPAGVAPRLAMAPPCVHIRRGSSAASTRRRHCSRHGDAHPAATASSATTATANAQTTRSSNSDPASVTPSATTTARAAASSLPSVRPAPSRCSPNRPDPYIKATVLGPTSLGPTRFAS